MQIGIVENTPRHSQLLGEIFSTWGAALTTNIAPAAVPSLNPETTPVVILPSGSEPHEEPLTAFAKAGGTVIAIMPSGALCTAAALTHKGVRDTPTSLRWSGFIPGGFEGETCPIIGNAAIYERTEAVEPLAHFAHLTKFFEKSVAITRSKVGSGTVICIAFDLPLCIMVMRQGDPAFAEVIPEGDGCARPSHMGARFEAGEAARIPFADLLARALVQLAVESLAFPCPLLNHMPGESTALLLYSGDEDGAPTSASDEEFDYLTQHGARMDLYIIPDWTESTPKDIERYLRHHDLGPHPNLRAFDRKPIPERLAQLESQIKLFTEKFGVEPLTLRNHCTAWAGYMEHVEVLEKCGVKMDGSYFPGRYHRGFDSSPYGAFGGAMPMKFTRPDGRLLNVYQQHTAISDDVFFAPDRAEFGAAHYSFNLTPEVSAVVMERMIRDSSERFHTPFSVNIHPGGWVWFSRDVGKMLVQTANRLGVPVWSFTQWCKFWMARATWRVAELSWQAPKLTATFTGTPTPSPLCVAIPCEHQGKSLTQIDVDGTLVAGTLVTRYRQRIALVELPAGRTRVTVEAKYK